LFPIRRKNSFRDSIKVKGNSSRGYISIPLQAKYKIAMGRKLCFYTTGGFAVILLIIGKLNFIG